MAGHRTGTKPLPKPMMPQFTHALCFAGPQWVNPPSAASSVGNSHRSASPKPTTLEEDQELFLIFLQFYVYDLRFKPWGPTTFLSFKHWLQAWNQNILLQPTCSKYHDSWYPCSLHHQGISSKDIDNALCEEWFHLQHLCYLSVEKLKKKQMSSKNFSQKPRVNTKQQYIFII